MFSFFQSSLNLVYTSVPNVDLPAMCHPRFRPGPPSDQAQILSERLFETLISYVFLAPENPSTSDTPYHHFYTPRAKMIPLQTLVIRSGKAVWTLYVDATCINYDGNVFDATLIAMISALFNGEPRSYIFSNPDWWLDIFSQVTEGNI